MHGQCLWTAALLPSYHGRLNWSLIHSLVWRCCLYVESKWSRHWKENICYSTDVCTSLCSSTVYQQGEAVLLEARVEALMHPPVTVYVDSCVATLKPDPSPCKATGLSQISGEYFLLTIRKNSIQLWSFLNSTRNTSCPSLIQSSCITDVLQTVYYQTLHLHSNIRSKITQSVIEYPSSPFWQVWGAGNNI